MPHEDAIYDRVGNILLSRIMAAEVRLVDEGFDIGIRRSWEQALNEVKSRGGRPYAIPAGASVHKYGRLGYVGFAKEVRAQLKQLGFAFDYIVVCTVTGSTHAGMLMQGMIDLVQKGFFPEGSRVLYPHLGGGPAINGYSSPSATADARHIAISPSCVPAMCPKLVRGPPSKPREPAVN
ncbi:hypothetical protein X771_25335 [Mesorhizobium sp. LSJC277A00]|nr:hypothetical protein X771_25335 [Mesorhizobium sp. LSJC277A00]